MTNENGSREHQSNFDKRQQENDNPDRPPVDPSKPNTPDPFDPFETTKIADGGAVTQDTTELTFESHLENALPSTVSPDTPTPPNQSGTKPTSSPTSTTVSEPEKPGTATKRVERIKQKAAEAAKDFDPSPPEEGTLIDTVRKHAQEISQTWSYMIKPGQNKTRVNHHAVTDSTAVFSLKHTEGSITVFHNPVNTHSISDPDPREHRYFDTAMAAFIEGVDWGSLPPGNDQPHIWAYEGYTGAETFEEYLSGKGEWECGDHYFGNTSADYGIHIGSFADLREDMNTGKTITIITISTEADRKQGDAIFRARFPGQQHAFDWLLNALAEDLSRKIALHNDDIGNLDRIPPVEFLQTQSLE